MGKVIVIISGLICVIGYFGAAVAIRAAQIFMERGD
jgi:hypothetical protein